MPCPTATSAPACRRLAPATSVAAVIAPGAITPDREITPACHSKFATSAVANPLS